MPSSTAWKKGLKYFAFVGITLLVGMDLVFSLQNTTSVRAVPVSQLKKDGLPPGYKTKVAFIRSDRSALSQPASLQSRLSREQILEMVSQILDLSGDLEPLLHPGAKITIKPDIVELAEEENGVNTDDRVVEGLIRWMEKKVPGSLKYTVAEAAGGWLSETMRNTKYNRGSAQIGDGFGIAGYTAMQQRLAADGITVQMVDANFGPPEDPLKGIRLVPVPDFIDFPEYPSYWVHEAILDPDVLINVPVMKTHTPQITVCLKNYIGIAAGARHGIDKGQGGLEPGDPIGLHQGWPDRNSVDREIVDLASLAPSDYCLVDAIVGKERAKTATDPTLRRNLLIAGKDMVAVDAICSRLMGLNPDNIPHLCEAAREGMGTIDSKQITVVGDGALEDSIYYFERSPVNFQGNRGHYGRTNRTWLLKSVAGADIENPYLGKPDAEVIPTAGADGWTEPIYFSDDVIDFEAYYGSANGNVYYAFCWVNVPEEQDAELWIAHDEPCAVWIGGQRVHLSKTAYTEFKLPSEAAEIVHLKAGRQPVLVKLVDRTKSAPFVLNLCRILPSELPSDRATYPNLRIHNNYRRYEGTRVLGLTFDVADQTDVPYWKLY